MAYSVTVRYGSMGLVGAFRSETPLRRRDRVVLRTERGNEDGEVVHPSEPVADPPLATEGDVIRMLTSEDEKELRRIREEAVPMELAFCRERIQALELPMKLVDAEHLLGGEKIIFYFLADGRVDFRQLVKDIAREYKTRIELRQIGVRDEARLLAELGHCGQCLCCRSFMKNLEPVTMRMAKSQKATLDPTKISGVCGRLMCCLRYEDKVYSELKAKLPKRGSNVVTRKATGKVVDADVLTQVLCVKTANANIVRVHISDVISIEGAATTAAAKETEEADDEAVQDARVADAPATAGPDQADRPEERSQASPKDTGGAQDQDRNRPQGPRDDRQQAPGQPRGPQQGQQGHRRSRRSRRNRSRRPGSGGN